MSAVIHWTRSGDVGMTPNGTMISRHERPNRGPVWIVSDEDGLCLGLFDTREEAEEAAR
jgi:hypothetical protein